VWWKGPGQPEKWAIDWDKDPRAHADKVFAGEQLLIDVDVGVPNRCSSVWRADSSREGAILHGMKPEAHLARCRVLAVKGYRPMALSLAEAPGEGILAASAWRRPVLVPSEMDRQARRRATAGATLLHLHDPEAVWPLFRRQPDPTVRSFLVQRAALLRVDARVLVRRLEQEQDASARAALIVALGDYSGQDFPADVRRPLAEKLLRWYRDDADAGVHGAIDWLLRPAEEGPEKRPLNWGRPKELEQMDQELKQRDPSRKRSWYVNGQGQTFSVVQGPVGFRMGSPPSEADRIENEKPHWRIINRNFAIATKAVTVAQWRRFLADCPDVPRDYLVRCSPVDDGPIIDVSWYMAARYCNWLSKKEGIPQSQWCYPEVIQEGMKPLANHLGRTGYRLPTEAEWEYACRAGTTSSRSYGSSAELLTRYAWCAANAGERTWPVGQKRPNDLGLFDMHGNVFTWCQDPAYTYLSGRVEDKEDLGSIAADPGRILRGASFLAVTPVVRSATRVFNRPTSRQVSIGLRVGRTTSAPGAGNAGQDGR
jgi:formylglycine-generating enzyme required for sulfatase activity